MPPSSTMIERHDSTLDETVTVRMSHELWEHVQREATRRAIGPTTLIRLLVLHALERVPATDIGTELRLIRESLERLEHRL